MEYCNLNDGILIPAIGFGPGLFPGNSVSRGWISKKGPHLLDLPRRVFSRFCRRPHDERRFVAAISSAIDNGFILIDYSAAYGDGTYIRRALRKSHCQSENIFLTARISNHAQREKGVRDEFFKTLAGYGVKKIDLLMFHWPVPGCYMETWQEMLKLRDEGFAKSLGVSNCHEHHIERILEAGVIPAVNQIEVHPLFTQKPLIRYCKDKGILVEAYTPIARFDDRLMRLPKLQAIAKKYTKTTVQVVLRWHVQNGVVPVVRSLNTGRQNENIDIFDFVLTDDEMGIIDSFNINSRLRYDPDNCDFSIL